MNCTATTWYGAVAAALVVALTACGDANGKKNGARPAPVKMAPAERGNFIVRATFTGSIVAEVADIAAETQGRLKTVPARLGDHVKPGDLLAEIDAGPLRLQLAAATARAKAAAAERQPAVRELQRSRPLVEQGLLSAQAVDELESKVQAIRAAADAAEAEAALLRRRVADASVRAPIAGIVSARHQDAGSWVAVGAPLFRIVSDTQVRARLRIPEAAVPELAPGQPVELDVGPAGQRRGKIAGVSGEIETQDQGAWAEVTLQDTKGLSHGTFVRAQVELRQLHDVAIVPSPAVLERLRDNALTKGIFVAANGQARWITTETLAGDTDRLAIAADITAGTPVLVRGHLALSDGSSIEIAP